MSNPHRDYAPFELPENMEEDLGLFNAAVQPRCKDLGLDSIDRILLLRDGEPHSDAVRQTASDVAAGLSASIDEFSCADGEELQVAKLESYGIVVAPCLLATVGLHDLSRMNQCIHTVFESSKVPILCVNQAINSDDRARRRSHALAAVSRNSQPDWLALSWAFRLAKQKVTILEWFDPESRGTGPLGSLDESAIGRSVTSQLGPLVGAAQRYAKVHGGQVHVEFRLGNPISEILDSAKASHANLLVIARGETPDCAHYQVAKRLLLEPQSQPMPSLLLIV